MLQTKKTEPPRAVDSYKRGDTSWLGYFACKKKSVYARFLALLSILLVSMALTGCVQAARTGVTNGVTRGFQNTISDIVEGILADILNTP